MATRTVILGKGIVNKEIHQGKVEEVGEADAALFLMYSMYFIKTIHP